MQTGVMGDLVTWVVFLVDEQGCRPKHLRHLELVQMLVANCRLLV